MNEATTTYVRQHADDNVRQLALCGSKNPEVDLPQALQQIAGRQTARQKLPTWAAHDGILYPPHLSMEQCSSEPTARYKQSVCRALFASMCCDSSGSVCHDSIATQQPLVDLTGGFGVDFSFLATLFKKAVYVERQEELCNLARHNLDVLGLEHAEVVCADSTDYLHHLDSASLIFVDPARRDAHGGRTYGIADCTPDVLTLRDELLQKAHFIMLKLSPMLDWHKTVEDLGTQWVREVHIVATGGECKELLIVLSAKESRPLRLICVNDDEQWEVPQASSTREQADNTPAQPTLQEATYLYEPNATIMKAGCFSELSTAFGVAPLAQNSHLFTADRLISDFPGRRFKVLNTSSMNKHELKEKVLPLRQANITTRNFPLSVAELRKRLKLSDGGRDYIFATTLADNSHVLIICQQVF